MKYRLKPLTVDAFHFTREACYYIGRWPEWLMAMWSRNSGEVDSFYPRENGGCAIKSPVGEKFVNYGDWIVRDENGSVSVWNDKLFNVIHEPVN